MADTHTSALPFEGVYGDLAILGLPIPIVVSLESQTLTLESAIWNARCSHAGFSVTLFWPTLENVRRNNKRKRTRQRKKLPAENKVECAKINTGSTVDDPACATAPMQKKLPAENKVVCSENNTGNTVDDPACATAPVSAPPVVTPPDTPAVCNFEKVHLESDGDNEDEDDPAVLDKIVQCGQNVYDKVEFVLEEGTGPALQFADKGGG